MIPIETARALADQLADPKHCFVRFGADLIRHHPNKNDPEDLHYLDGTPIRFSRLAAENVCRKLEGAKIEELPPTLLGVQIEGTR